jgi:hypothetical protein
MLKLLFSIHTLFIIKKFINYGDRLEVIHTICSIHPSMTGTIVVTNGTPAANSNSNGTSGSSVGY